MFATVAADGPVVGVALIMAPFLFVPSAGFYPVRRRPARQNLFCAGPSLQCEIRREIVRRCKWLWPRVEISRCFVLSKLRRILFVSLCRASRAVKLARNLPFI